MSFIVVLLCQNVASWPTGPNLRKIYADMFPISLCFPFPWFLSLPFPSLNGLTIMDARYLAVAELLVVLLFQVVYWPTSACGFSWTLPSFIHPRLSQHQCCLGLNLGAVYSGWHCVLLVAYVQTAITSPCGSCGRSLSRLYQLFGIQLWVVIRPPRKSLGVCLCVMSVCSSGSNLTEKLQVGLHKNCTTYH